MLAHNIIVASFFSLTFARFFGYVFVFTAVLFILHNLLCVYRLFSALVCCCSFLFASARVFCTVCGLLRDAARRLRLVCAPRVFVAYGLHRLLTHWFLRASSRILSHALFHIARAHCHWFMVPHRFVPSRCFAGFVLAASHHRLHTHLLVRTHCTADAPAYTRLGLVTHWLSRHPPVQFVLRLRIFACGHCVFTHWVALFTHIRACLPRLAASRLVSGLVLRTGSHALFSSTHTLHSCTHGHTRATPAPRGLGCRAHALLACALLRLGSGTSACARRTTHARVPGFLVLRLVCIVHTFTTFGSRYLGYGCVSRSGHHHLVLTFTSLVGYARSTFSSPHTRSCIFAVYRGCWFAAHASLLASHSRFTARGCLRFSAHAFTRFACGYTHVSGLYVLHTWLVWFRVTLRFAFSFFFFFFFFFFSPSFTGTLPFSLHARLVLDRFWFVTRISLLWFGSVTAAHLFRFTITWFAFWLGSYSCRLLPSHACLHLCVVRFYPGSRLHFSPPRTLPHVGLPPAWILLPVYILHYTFGYTPFHTWFTRSHRTHSCWFCLTHGCLTPPRCVAAASHCACDTRFWFVAALRGCRHARMGCRAVWRTGSPHRTSPAVCAPLAAHHFRLTHCCQATLLPSLLTHLFAFGLCRLTSRFT